MTKEKKGSSPSFASIIEQKMVPTTLGREVLLSLIIPTQNCSELVGVTLESIQRQNYPRLEVIVVDATSKDRTLEIVSAYAPLITRVYTVTDYNAFDMINRGFSLASGRYIAVALPGVFYLSNTSFLYMAHAALANDYPALLYCGTLQREAKGPPKMIHGMLCKEFLVKGSSPATLPACWYRADIFETIGKFRTDYIIRSPFELFCRLGCQEELKKVRVERVLVDYDVGPRLYTRIFRFATETYRILLEHFGFFRALAWLFGVNRFRLVKWFWGSTKERYFKQ